MSKHDKPAPGAAKDAASRAQRGTLVPVDACIDAIAQEALALARKQEERERIKRNPAVLPPKTPTLE